MPLSRSLPAVMPRSPSSVRRLSDSAGIAVAGGGGLAMPSRADAAFREYDMTVLPRSSIGLVLAAALAASPVATAQEAQVTTVDPVLLRHGRAEGMDWRTIVLQPGGSDVLGGGRQ